MEITDGMSINHDLHNPTRHRNVKKKKTAPNRWFTAPTEPWGWHEDGVLCEARVWLSGMGEWVGVDELCEGIWRFFSVSKQQWNLNFPSSPEPPTPPHPTPEKCQLLEGKRGVRQKLTTYSHSHMQVYTNTSGHCFLSSVSWSDRILKKQLNESVMGGKSICCDMSHL